MITQDKPVSQVILRIQLTFQKNGSAVPYINKPIVILHYTAMFELRFCRSPISNRGVKIGTQEVILH